MSDSETYCPACRGHGTNVHECEEHRSAVVNRKGLVDLLDTMDALALVIRGSVQMMILEKTTKLREQIGE